MSKLICSIFMFVGLACAYGAVTDEEMLSRARDLYPTNWISLRADRRPESAHAEFYRINRNRICNGDHDPVADYLVTVVTSTVVNVSGNTCKADFERFRLYEWDMLIDGALGSSRSIATNSVHCLSLVKYAASLNEAPIPQLNQRAADVPREELKTFRNLQLDFQTANLYIRRFREGMLGLCHCFLHQLKQSMPCEEFESFTNQLKSVQGLTESDREQLLAD